MKRTFNFIALLCILYPLAQGQIPFLNNKSKWIVKHEETNVWDNTGSTEYINYTFGNDTTLLNETWKILLEDSIPIGAFQENEEKIYYYSFNWPEEIASKKRLFYDFSKNEGDTLYYCYLYDYESGYLCDNREEAYANNNYYYNYTVVRDVKTECGRKVINLSDDRWIEGIGSTRSFFGRFHQIPIGYSVPSYSIYQMICDGVIVYTYGRLTDPNYKPKYLKKGMTWYVKDAEKENSVLRYELGTPNNYNGWLTFPVIHKEKNIGCVYEDKGVIYWEVVFDETIIIYDFSLEKGDKTQLYDDFQKGQNLFPRKTEYTVSEVDTVFYEGQPRKRIRLEGPIPQD